MDINLNDGSKISVERAENGFYSADDVLHLLTPANLSSVRIDGANYAGFAVAEYYEQGDGFYFELRPKNAKELESEARLNAVKQQLAELQNATADLALVALGGGDDE